jgi:hypothetical protein
MIQLYEKGQNGFPEATIVYTPDVVDPKGLPVFIYLHGRGEHGNGDIPSLFDYVDNKGHLPNWLSDNDENGNFIGLKIGSEYYKPPFIICCPLMARDVVLEGKQLFKYRGHIGNFFETDSVGIGGISFGGKGTLKARVEYPDLFKCFLPMAPAYLAKENLPDCKAPMWSHHGANDMIVHPNWSVWNTEYSAKDKGGLEEVIKKRSAITALNNLNEILEDINGEWFPTEKEWLYIYNSAHPQNDACTIYAGKDHGIQYHVLHQKRVWSFLEYHLQSTQPEPEPEPEERPLKDVDTVALTLIYEYISLEEAELTKIYNELSKRAEETYQRIKTKLST